MITHNKNFRTITNNDNILKTRFRRQIQSDIRRCEEVTVGEREEMVAELVNKYSI